MQTVGELGLPQLHEHVSLNCIHTDQGECIRKQKSGQSFWGSCSFGEIDHWFINLCKGNSFNKPLFGLSCRDETLMMELLAWVIRKKRYLFGGERAVRAIPGCEIPPFQELSTYTEASSHLPWVVRDTASLSGYHLDLSGVLGFLEMKSFLLSS